MWMSIDLRDDHFLSRFFAFRDVKINFLWLENKTLVDMLSDCNNVCIPVALLVTDDDPEVQDFVKINP